MVRRVRKWSGRLVIVAAMVLAYHYAGTAGALDQAMGQAKYAAVRQAVVRMETDAPLPILTPAVQEGADRLFTWLWQRSSPDEQAVINRYLMLRSGADVGAEIYLGVESAPPLPTSPALPLPVLDGPGMIEGG